MTRFVFGLFIALSCLFAWLTFKNVVFVLPDSLCLLFNRSIFSIVANKSFLYRSVMYIYRLRWGVLPLQIYYELYTA